MRRWALLLASSWLTACHGEDPSMVGVCPRARAAFALQISSTDGGLPPTLSVEIGFGGAESERYSLHKGNANNDVLCCSNLAGVSLRPLTCEQPLNPVASAPDASADAAVPKTVTPASSTQLQCQVWTNGAAELSVTARGYPPLARTLMAQRDEAYPQCDVWETVHVAVPLQPGDAGVNSR
jgi:hypothetical protein